jgi:hypothetical protein
MNDNRIVLDLGCDNTEYRISKSGSQIIVTINEIDRNALERDSKFISEADIKTQAMFVVESESRFKELAKIFNKVDLSQISGELGNESHFAFRLKKENEKR